MLIFKCWAGANYLSNKDWCQLSLPFATLRRSKEGKGAAGEAKEKPSKVEHPLPVGGDDEGEPGHEGEGQQHHRPLPAQLPGEQGGTGAHHGAANVKEGGHLIGNDFRFDNISEQK